MFIQLEFRVVPLLDTRWNFHFTLRFQQVGWLAFNDSAKKEQSEGGTLGLPLPWAPAALRVWCRSTQGSSQGAQPSGAEAALSSLVYS